MNHSAIMILDTITHPTWYRAEYLLYQVQKLLTHKDSSTTMRYAHLSDKSLRDTVNLSDELLAPSKGKDTTTTKRA
jgi:integrase